MKHFKTIWQKSRVFTVSTAKTGDKCEKFGSQSMSSSRCDEDSLQELYFLLVVK